MTADHAVTNSLLGGQSLGTGAFSMACLTWSSTSQQTGPRTQEWGKMFSGASEDGSGLWIQDTASGFIFLDPGLKDK